MTQELHTSSSKHIITAEREKLSIFICIRITYCELWIDDADCLQSTLLTIQRKKHCLFGAVKLQLNYNLQFRFCTKSVWNKVNYIYQLQTEPSEMKTTTTTTKSSNDMICGPRFPLGRFHTHWKASKPTKKDHKLKMNNVCDMFNVHAYGKINHAKEIADFNRFVLFYENSCMFMRLCESGMSRIVSRFLIHQESNLYRLHIIWDLSSFGIP